VSLVGKFLEYDLWICATDPILWSLAHCYCFWIQAKTFWIALTTTEPGLETAIPHIERRSLCDPLSKRVNLTEGFPNEWQLLRLGMIFTTVSLLAWTHSAILRSVRNKNCFKKIQRLRTSWMTLKVGHSLTRAFPVRHNRSLRIANRKIYKQLLIHKCIHSKKFSHPPDY